MNVQTRTIGHPRRSGAAVAMVLLLMAIATTLGLSYLASTSISLAASQGHEDATVARYLAESGIQHAICLLRENPDMLIAAVGTTLGPYRVDGEGTEYTFSVTPLGVPGYFSVRCTAESGRSTQTVGATVFRSGGTQRPIEQALLIGGTGGTVGRNADVRGDMHSNDWAIVYGRVRGDATAVGYVFNLGRIDGSVKSFVDPVPMPLINPADYETYLYNDLPGEAVISTIEEMREGDALDEGGAITEANPAGVVIVHPPGGSLRLLEDVEFRGTLVVHGDLILADEDVSVTAQEGFPALVVTGGLYVTEFADDVNIFGTVYAAQGVRDSATGDSSSTRFEGSVVTGSGGFSAALRGDHRINYQGGKWSTLYDPRGWGYGGKVEVLGWHR